MGRPDNRHRKRRPKLNRAPGTALACASFWERYNLAVAARMECPWDTRLERYPAIASLTYQQAYAVRERGRRWRKVKRHVVARRRE